MTRPPQWAIDAANKRQQQRDDMRRRGFGLPAARDLADIMDRIERAEAVERARQASSMRDSDELFPVDAVPVGCAGVAETIAACLLIVAVLVIAFLF